MREVKPKPLDTSDTPQIPEPTSEPPNPKPQDKPKTLGSFPERMNPESQDMRDGVPLGGVAPLLPQLLDADWGGACEWRAGSPQQRWWTPTPKF